MDDVHDNDAAGKYADALPWQRAGYPRPLDFESNSVWRRYTHSWGSPLLLRGAKQGLQSDDAYPLLGRLDRVETLVSSYENYYSIDDEQADARERAAEADAGAGAATPVGRKPQRRNGFLLALLKSSRKYIIIHSLWTAVEIVFRVLSPVALRQFIDFLDRYEDSESSTSEGEGWGWAAAIVLFGVGVVLAHHQIFWTGMRLGFHMKQQAIAAVQEKLLRLNGATLGNLSTGQVINLVSNDVRRFDDSGPFWVFMWAGPVETVVVLVLISLELGFLPAFLGVSTLLLVVPLNAWLARHIAALRLQTARQTDERVRLTGELLEGVTAVKMLTWERPFMDVIDRIRSREVIPMWTMLMINGASLALMFFCVPVASLVTFSTACYVQNDTLHLDSVFYVVALLHLPKLWLALFFVKGVKSTSETLVAARRVNDFLTELEAVTPVDAASEELPVGTIEMRGADFSWTSRAWAGSSAPALQHSASHRLEGDAKLPKAATASLHGAGLYRTALRAPMTLSRTVRAASELLRSPSRGAAAAHVPRAPAAAAVTLHEPRFTIAPGALVGVCGQVGCGKSSLLSALLGELQPVPPDDYIVGDAIPGAPRMSGSVAYCQQIPWIEAASVRENVVFGDPNVDEDRVVASIEACALAHDVANLPAGYDTEIGERGVNLSGGQKARLALARAVYRRADICLLDDPLSAVDARVAASLFERCIGPHGALKASTRLLVTHQTQWLHKCDRILVMREGRVVADGAWAELVDRDDLPELHTSGTEGALQHASFDVPATSGDLPHGTPSADRSADVPSDMQLIASHMCELLADSESGRSAQDPTLSPQALSSSRHGPSLRVAAQDAAYDVDHDDVQLPQLPFGPDTSPVHAGHRSARSGPFDPAGPVAEGVDPRVATARDSDSTGRAPGDDGVARSTSTSSSDERSWKRHAGGGGKVRSRGGQAAPPAGPTGERSGEGARAGALTNAEHREKGRLANVVWLQYIRALGVLPTLIILLALFAGQAAWILSEWWLAEWASEDADSQDSKRWLGVYAALVLAVVLLSLSRSFGFFTLALSASTSLNKRMLRSVLHAPLSFFHTNPTGRILNVFSKDQGSIDEQLPEVSFDALQTISTVLGAFLLICIANPVVIPVFVPLTWAFLSVRAYYLKSSREVKRLEAVTRSPVYAQFSATLRGLATIRAYRVSYRFRDTFARALDLNGSWWMAFLSCSRWVGFRMDVISWALLSAAVILAMAFKSLVSAALLALALTHTLQLSGSMQWAVRQTAEAENYLTSVERVLAYCSLPQERPGVDVGAPAPPPSWPTTATLEFQNVTARYRPGLPPVLNDLSFSIESGTTCGIVGRTGSGKSSLLLTLFEMIELDSGRVLIDGLDVATIGLDALRRQIAVIPQDPVLFSGSLRTNLDPWGSTSELQIWQVLEKVQLKDKVERLGGLESVMAEAGSNMSAGQRQLVCLARALLADARILALDEATANVDRSTDAIIQSTLRNAVKERRGEHERIMLVIAHRVGTIMDCDQLLVLSDGTLVESGPPRQLAAGNGIFGSLVSAAASNERQRA